MLANLANDSSTSRQIKETSRSIGYTAQPTPGEAASFFFFPFFFWEEKPYIASP